MLIEHKNQQSQHAHHDELMKQMETENTAFFTQSAAYHTEYATITQNADTIAQEETHLEKRKAAYQQFVSLGNWINNELSSLANKKKLVHEDDPSCPLCEQNLSAARKRFLKLNFEKQESFLAHRLRRLKRIIPTLKEILIKQHAHITADKEKIQQATALQAKIKNITDQQTKLNDRITQTKIVCKKIEKEIELCTATIAAKQKESDDQLSSAAEITDPSYCPLIEQKKSLEKKLNTHVYSEINYKKDQEQLKIVELQLADYESLQKDVTHQEHRKNEISKYSLLLKRLNLDTAQIEKKRTDLGDLQTQLTILQKKEADIAQQCMQLKHSTEELSHKKGSIENQQKYLFKIKNEFDQEQHVIAQLDTTIEDYQTIATATGKDGIQALLIEEAIPEIEQEANYLLSRLTNNQAQIFIESLRDLKKGGTKETLDIKISDQAGIRPYELFSGGEAFRIDFALRIAISKLLARRAGTALQILIIDEGFGSQDEEGLGYIMDALYKIQDDFSKIIIVSHLPSMKDQFPVQFLIEKGVQGSTVSIIEQG